MKGYLFVIFILLLTGNIYAAEIFSDKSIKEIDVINTQQSDSVAQIRNNDGIIEEVAIGDVIGSEQGEIVEIGPLAITVAVGRARIKMPVIPSIHE